MEINLNTAVECEGRVCGAVTNIIINPVTQTLAYIAIMDEKEPRRELLVTIGMIGSITPEQVHLQCTGDELNRFPRFTEQDFVKMEVPDGSLAGCLMLPYVLPENLMIPIQHKRIPGDKLAVHRGARVQAIDGEAGRVDEFLADAANGQITHLVMRQEHVIGPEEVSIPLDTIEHEDEQNVYLTLDKEGMMNLPHIPIRRSFMPDWYWAHALVIKSVTSSAHQIENIAKLIAELASRSGQRRIQARQKLVSLGRSTIPSLNGLLENRRHQVRWEAAKSMAQINDTDCIPGLLKALEDERFEIRWVAAEGLSALGMPAVKHLLKLLQAKPDSLWLREGAHHVIRSVIGDEPWPELKSVLLELEKLDSVAASVPCAAKLALASLRTYADHENG